MKFRAWFLRALALGGTLASGGHAWAATLRVPYAFAFPGADACAEAQGHCRPWDENADLFAQERHPIVPVRVAKVLIPDGEVVVSARFVPGRVTHVPFTPDMAAEQRPLTAGVTIVRDIPSYEGGPYPGRWLGDVKTVVSKGYVMAHIPVYPMQYDGVGGASLAWDGQLVVETEPRPGTYALTRRPMLRDAKEIHTEADNGTPDKVRIVPGSERVAYLVIGPARLIGDGEADSPLKPLLDEKRRRQIEIVFAKLEDVAPGRRPEEIRDYIRGQYRDKGVDYVLLVGDKENLPWKYVRSGVNDRSDPVPSDQFYACLDGDFSRPADIDWACEVSVGRVGAKTRQHVADWVEKTLRLQAIAKEGRPVKVLNYGEKLDGRTLAGRMLDFLEAGRNDGVSTKPFPANTSFTKLYDTFGERIPGNRFVATWNGDDYHVVNHLGHSNETFTLNITAQQLDTITARPSFVYTQGCFPNSPDADNITIRAVRMAKSGPAAMIANTRYGWYAPGGSGEGSSSLLHRAFWNARFGEGHKTIGKMNHKAKEKVTAFDRSSLMIYTALESNLIGDPELDLGIR